jgi:integrase
VSAWAGVGPAYQDRPQGIAGEGATPRRLRTVWQAEPLGFGLREYASGRRVWIAQSRMGGRTRTITLGKAAVLSEHEARVIARQVLHRANIGDNPAEARERARSAPLFADYLDEYWRRCGPRWKPSTRVTHDIYRRRYLNPAFAGQYVDAITEADVTRWFVRLTDRAGPGGANRTMEILSAMLARAVAWGYRPDGTNPCQSVRRNRRRKCDRYLSDAELARLGEVMALELVQRPVQATALLLLALTGCRMSEILGLSWADVRGRKLHLQDSKTGPRTVQLGTAARALIDGLERRPQREHLFHSERTHQRLRSLDSYWSDVRVGAGLSNVRLHDLRHTFASHAARGSETMPMISRLLGHGHVRSTARYVHLDDADAITGNQIIGDVIASYFGDRWA